MLAQRAIPAQTAQALGLTMYIVALIAEHCDLDAVAPDDEAVQGELNKIIKGVSVLYGFSRADVG